MNQKPKTLIAAGIDELPGDLGEDGVVLVVSKQAIVTGKQALKTAVFYVEQLLIAIATDNGSSALKQIQHKPNNLPVLLQLLDLEASNASRDEICQQIKRLKDTAANGPQYVTKLLHDLRQQAQYFVTVGWKELAVLDHHHQLFPPKAMRKNASLNSEEYKLE